MPPPGRTCDTRWHRILIQSGEFARVLNLIEPLLTTPASDLTPAYFRLDPVFKPLRGNPRFEQLAL
jgi:hypothetical protein